MTFMIGKWFGQNKNWCYRGHCQCEGLLKCWNWSLISWLVTFFCSIVHFFFNFTLFLLLIIINILATQLQAELGKPSLSQPDKGKVFIYIDCSSTAEPAFEVAYSVSHLHPLSLVKSFKYFGLLHIIQVSWIGLKMSLAESNLVQNDS
jgi:hypothetical protein